MPLRTLSAVRVRFALAKRLLSLIVSAVVVQKVFVADDFHGKTRADQGGEDRLRRADHNALFLAAVGIFSVGSGQQSFHRRILGWEIDADLLDGYVLHPEPFADPGDESSSAALT